ncbi:alpha/beta hydrolase [Angustibacter speluncae]
MTETGTAAAVDTRTLEVPGATVTYDVHGDLSSGTTPLFLIGSPMDATGFGTLAGHFADRPVVTYDPRGTGRSTRPDPTLEQTPDDHVVDLHAVVEALGVGPVDVFASSGGAVNALAWVATHPGDVRTLVAHEPPLVEVLEDREVAAAVVEDMHRTYHAQGMGTAMAKFIALTSHDGVLPADYLDRPAPGPEAFGMPADDDGSRDDSLMAQNLRGCCLYTADLDAVAAAPTRVVVAAGEESGATLAARGSAGVAARLGEPVTAFPSDHGGFLGGEYGMSGKPDEFAARLREVLSGS